MKLHRVQIKNFRSIRDITIHFQPKCLILVGINESGKTNIFNALGYSIFQHLRPSNLIFEGWRDKQLFDISMKDFSAATKPIRHFFSEAGVCFCKGVKDIGRVSAMLELARRKAVIVSDADKPAKEQQKSYKGSYRWIRYDEVEKCSKIVTGEDFIEFDAFKPVLAAIKRECASLDAIPLEAEFNGTGAL